MSTGNEKSSGFPPSPVWATISASSISVNLAVVHAAVRRILVGIKFKLAVELWEAAPHSLPHEHTGASIFSRWPFFAKAFTLVHLLRLKRFSFLIQSLLVGL